jgi:hypothetical protein
MDWGEVGFDAIGDLGIGIVEDSEHGVRFTHAVSKRFFIANSGVLIPFHALLSLISPNITYKRTAQ